MQYIKKPEWKKYKRTQYVIHITVQLAFEKIAAKLGVKEI